jgi:putative metallohydrolase (TIGR04338 family)
MPASPLPGLDACATFVDRVVGTLWWQARFPRQSIDLVPRLRPGNGARQAFFRPGEDVGEDPTITLPRRYRTKGVVLHELVHWALWDEHDLPHHGRTFTRVLLDITDEFLGADRAAILANAYRAERVHVGRPARSGPDGRPRYGWDERLRLSRGRPLAVRFRSADDDAAVAVGVLVTTGSGGHRLELDTADGRLEIPTKAVWSVERVGTAAEHQHGHGDR